MRVVWCSREEHHNKGRRKGEVRRAGGATTVFGDRLHSDGSDDSLRSILAQEAQAMELWLLLPIVEMARSTDEFSIVLWQHDGFSAAFRDRSRARRWVGRFQEAVARRAGEQGIATELEAEEL